jgi:pyrroline-5-carboxylate reductase
VLSIAAGVRLAELEAALPPGTAVVRAMPNTPALIGAGAAAIAGGTSAAAADLAWAEEVLGAVGLVVRVDESLLDAVTGLSGSGPAYVFLVAEALVEAGVLVGLPRPIASELAVQTLPGRPGCWSNPMRGPRPSVPR